MAFKVEFHKGIVKIELPDSPSMDDFTKIKKRLEDVEDISVVKVDLRKCSYIQSKVVSNIIALKKMLNEKKAKLILTNVQEGVMQLLEITNLINFVQIEKDFSSYSVDELAEFFIDPEVCDAVSDYIATHYNDEFRNKMFELLNSDDPIFKEYAILTIGKAHDVTALDTIRHALNDEVGNVNKAAILVLGWMGDEESKEEIYSFLESDFIDVAEAAAASIALLSDEDDSHKLGEFLKSPDERLRRIAIQALTLINDDDSYNFLKNHVKNETSEMVRATLAKSLSFYNKAEVADILLDLLKDESLKVREAAASSLIRINAKSKIGDILQRVTDEDSWVGYFAAKAIGELCREKTCSDYLIKVYDRVEQNVKLAIVHALGNIGINCSDFLMGLMSDKNEDIRKEALEAIYKIEKEKAVEMAERALDEDDNWVVRFKAVDILANAKPSGYQDFLRSIYEKENNRYVKEKILSVLEGL